MNNKIDLIYIAGNGRSGTTLLELMLSQSDDIFCCGELLYFWDRSIRDKELCTCGQAVVDCEEWIEILKRMKHYGFDSNQNLNSLFYLREKFTQIKKTMFWYSQAYLRHKKTLIRDFLYPLYNSIRDVRQEKYILDSSKNPGYLYLLSKCDFINLNILHMYRDSRGVAYSWQRRKKRIDAGSENLYMPQINPYYTALQWLIFNTLIYHLVQNQPYMKVHYDWLTLSPVEVITKIASFLEINNAFKITNHCFTIADVHSVAGNPFRIKADAITIKNDDTWKTKMPILQRAALKILTWPLLGSYLREQSKICLKQKI